MAKRALKISPFWAERLYPSAFVDAHPLAPAKSLGNFPSELAAPADHSANSIRNWIKAICRRLDIKPTTLAKQAKLAPSTVNRFLTGKGPLNVAAQTIEALANAAAEIYSKSLSADPTAYALDTNIFLDPNISPSLVTVPVIGRVEAGSWREAIEFPPTERYNITAAVETTYARAPLVALEVRGESMNKLYPDGSIVICVPFYRLDRRPRPGERVVVNQRNGAAIESTVKEFAVDPQGNAWLLPLSTDPAHQKAIYLDPDRLASDDQDLVISLLVIGSYRPERTIVRENAERWAKQLPFVGYDDVE